MTRRRSEMAREERDRSAASDAVGDRDFDRSDECGPNGLGAPNALCGTLDEWLLALLQQQVERRITSVAELIFLRRLPSDHRVLQEFLYY